MVLIVFLALLQVVSGAPVLEFQALTALPPGYDAGAAITMIKDKSKSTLAGVSGVPGKPFKNAAGMAMSEKDFYITPVSSVCPPEIPYPKIGSHAVCISPLPGKPGSPMWHCEWETEYTLAKIPGGCSGVKIECTDASRTTRIVNKYDWIRSKAGTDMGPEMHNVHINDYAQACVKHHCLGFPNPGAAPAVDRLFEVNSVEAEMKGAGSSTMIMAINVGAALLITVGGFAYAIRRIRRQPSAVPVPELADEAGEE